MFLLYFPAKYNLLSFTLSNISQYCPQHRVKIALHLEFSCALTVEKKELKLSPTDLRSCSSRKRIQKRDQRESDSFCQSTGKIRSTSAAPLVAIQKMREREAHTPTHGKASEKEAKATQKA